MFQLGPRYVTVNVTVLPDQDPNYQFSSPDGIWANGKLTFQNGGHNGFYVNFVLLPPAPGSNIPQYYFAANKNAAINAKKLVTPDDACPDQLPANQFPWSQFKPDTLSGDLKTLTVRNPNAPGQECEFGFSLFVTTKSDGSGPYLKVDPIGDNQNGPVHFNWAAVATATVAAVAIAAFVAFQLGLFSR